MLAQEKTHHEKAAGESAAAHEAISILEQKVIQIKLNGYETATPFGKETVSAEAKIVTSFVNTDLLTEIKATLLHTFRPKAIETHSFPAAAYSVIRDLYSSAGSDFCIVDVGGETTEVSLVAGGALLETFSFPLGHNQLLRRICNALDVPRAVGISSLCLYLEGKTFSKTNGKMESAVMENQAEWDSSFKDALISLGEQGGIPALYYLICEAPFSNFFACAIAAAREQADTKNIVSFDERVLGKEYDPSGHTADIFLSLQGLFLNTLHSTKK